MLRWRIIFLVSIAIAVSYLDRQTLPVAIKALEQDIPINNQQFALLQTAFLFAPGGCQVLRTNAATCRFGVGLRIRPNF